MRGGRRDETAGRRHYGDGGGVRDATGWLDANEGWGMMDAGVRWRIDDVHVRHGLLRVFGGA